jgi:hypothetical protein
MRFNFPGRDQIHELTSVPTMAVDLGFGASKSCGLTWQNPNGEIRTRLVDFGQCVETVADFLSDNVDSTLIIEAPLSGLFDLSGNPRGRLPFEKVSIDGKSRSRYWYVQGGAVVALSAMFLLHRVAGLVTSESNIVNLVEGFVSFKTRRSDHTEDALALLTSLREPSTGKVYDVQSTAPGERPMNMLSIVGLVPPEESCPPVVVVTV